jgi:hypothetical protein
LRSISIANDFKNLEVPQGEIKAYHFVAILAVVHFLTRMIDVIHGNEHIAQPFVVSPPILSLTFPRAITVCIPNQWGAYRRIGLTDYTRLQPPHLSSREAAFRHVKHTAPLTARIGVGKALNSDLSISEYPYTCELVCYDRSNEHE